jgi:shikimate kinase
MPGSPEAPGATAAPVSSASSEGKPAAQDAMERVVLTGFMGSGKSTIGRLLARQLGWRFYDIDAEIEASAGTTIAEYFLAHGEPAFRELEHRTVRHFLAFDRLVLALGGGSIEDPRTRALLLETESTRLIHLEAKLETVLERCKGTEKLRPVLADTLNLAARYERRLPLYRQAHISIAVDRETPQELAIELARRLGRVPARS